MNEKQNPSPECAITIDPERLELQKNAMFHYDSGVEAGVHTLPQSTDRFQILCMKVIMLR
jgi:hypothetical protein